MGSPGRLKTFPLGLARGDVAPEDDAVSTESGTCLLPYSSSENKQTEEQDGIKSNCYVSELMINIKHKLFNLVQNDMTASFLTTITTM